jgi:ribosome-binding protein aMBF1 (putative translation factor)
MGDDSGVPVSPAGDRARAVTWRRERGSMPSKNDSLQRLRDELRRRRMERGLSITDVAQEAGVGPSRIERIESGELESPRLLHIARLARFYGMDGNTVFALLDIDDRD